MDAPPLLLSHSPSSWLLLTKPYWTAYIERSCAIECFAASRFNPFKTLKGESDYLPVTEVRARPLVLWYQHLVCTHNFMVPIVSWDQPFLCTNHFFVPTISLYQPFLCTNHFFVPTISLYQPFLCTNHSLVLMFLWYQQVVCTSSLMVPLAS
jgi:hypothetical protein